MTSGIFDKIRIKPSEERQRGRRTTDNRDKPPAGTLCAYPGCESKATHKAPRKRGEESEYIWFCLKHVREYNKNYNYFAGMDDSTIAKAQKANTFGDRPTWKMGVNSAAQKHNPKNDHIHDPFQFMADRTKKAQEEHVPPTERKILNLERNALETLGFDGPADKPMIKERFKELVKKHHPDVNGGDKASESRLREIIQAYNYLKSTGLC